MSKFERLEDFDRQLLDWIKEDDAGHARNCIFNAIQHFKLAEKIKYIDSEMAIFRLITAEEEVAMAILLTLEKHKYNNVDKINKKEHKYKQGLDFFLNVIQNFLASCSKDDNFPKEFKLFLNKNKKLLEVEFSIGESTELIKPMPPLNFSMTVNDKTYYFKDELENLASKNTKKISKQIEKKAKLRNEILYASTNGIPKLDEDIDSLFDTYHKTVFRLIRVYYLIYPYKKEKFEFVQNAIDAYISMMKRD